MEDDEWKLSERVVYTVAEALDTDPADLPPLEKSLSSDSLDYLFHRKNQPPGAYTVFPYSGIWVVVHSTGTVDVFEEYRASNPGNQAEENIRSPEGDRQVVFHFSGENYAFDEDELETLHEIIAEADDSDDAWERAMEYAREQAA